MCIRDRYRTRGRRATPVSEAAAGTPRHGSGVTREVGENSSRLRGISGSTIGTR